MRSLLQRGGGAGHPHHRARASSGMVTAEFAVGLVAVMPVLLALVAVLGIGVQHVRLVEAARTGARMMARGDSSAEMRSEVLTNVPGVDVVVHTEGDSVRVVVSRPLAGQGLLPGFTLRAEAVAARESAS